MAITAPHTASRRVRAKRRKGPCQIKRRAFLWVWPPGLRHVSDRKRPSTGTDHGRALGQGLRFGCGLLLTVPPDDADGGGNPWALGQQASSLRGANPRNGIWNLGWPHDERVTDEVSRRICSARAGGQILV